MNNVYLTNEEYSFQHAFNESYEDLLYLGLYKEVIEDIPAMAETLTFKMYVLKYNSNLMMKELRKAMWPSGDK